jgi:predicted transposase/invertase (TIGR01784 family)
MNSVHQPHDKFFKISMKQKQVAIDFLRSHLPLKVFKLIDCNTLELTSHSFVLPDLQEIHSDLVLSVSIRTKTRLHLLPL